jgi:hypothetical protein
MAKFTDVRQYRKSVLQERADFIPVPDAQLCTVLHEVEAPLSRALLIVPLASKRHTAYRPWLQWAGYMAARRIEVLRFDKSRVGESTGLSVMRRRQRFLTVQRLQLQPHRPSSVAKPRDTVWRRSGDFSMTRGTTMHDLTCLSSS